MQIKAASKPFSLNSIPVHKLIPNHLPDQTPLERKSGPSKTQVQLYRVMKELFPNEDIHLDYRRADMVFPGMKFR